MNRSRGDRSVRFVQSSILLPNLLVLVLFAVAAVAQDSTNQGLRPLRVDASKVTGTIRSFQGLNGPPTPVMAGLPNLEQQYKELRVNQVRTHDFMGPTELDSKFEEDKRVAHLADP